MECNGEIYLTHQDFELTRPFEYHPAAPSVMKQNRSCPGWLSSFSAASYRKQNEDHCNPTPVDSAGRITLWVNTLAIYRVLRQDLTTPAVKMLSNFPFPVEGVTNRMLPGTRYKISYPTTVPAPPTSFRCLLTPPPSLPPPLLVFPSPAAPPPLFPPPLDNPPLQWLPQQYHPTPANHLCAKAT